MSARKDAERSARVTLSFLADPGDAVLGAALRARSATEVLALTTGTWGAGDIPLALEPETEALAKAMRKWRRRLSLVPTAGMVAAWQDSGLRLVIPGDAEYPSQLDDLGDARPLLLWVKGGADLRYACLRSASIVGARAASNYGIRAGLEIAAGLAERGTTVISGGA